MKNRFYLMVLFIFLLVLTGCTTKNELPDDLRLPQNYDPDYVHVSASIYTSYAAVISDEDDINMMINVFSHLTFKESDESPSLGSLSTVHIGDYFFMVNSQGTVYVLDGVLTVDDQWYESVTQINTDIFNDFT